MKEFKTGCATVRIHGKAERERIEEATKQFAKKVMRCKKTNLGKSK